MVWIKCTIFSFEVHFIRYWLVEKVLLVPLHIILYFYFNTINYKQCLPQIIHYFFSIIWYLFLYILLRIIFFCKKVMSGYDIGWTYFSYTYYLWIWLKKYFLMEMFSSTEKLWMRELWLRQCVRFWILDFIKMMKSDTYLNKILQGI